MDTDLYRKCDSCKGEGVVPLPMPLVTHEDATDWNDQEERALSDVGCSCPACHGAKYIPVAA